MKYPRTVERMQVEGDQPCTQPREPSKRKSLRPYLTIFASGTGQTICRSPSMESSTHYLEGPSFDRLGNLYCVDLVFGRIFCVDTKGEFHVVVEYDGEPNGLKIHRDGRLFVADRRHGIIVIDPATKRIQNIVERYNQEPFKGPNDLVFSPAGDLYFTDQGMSDLVNATGRVFRLRADGRLDLLLEKLPSPYGIALDPSGRVLYVALTRANSIIKVPVLPDGRPIPRAEFYPAERRRRTRRHCRGQRGRDGGGPSPAGCGVALR